MSAFNSDCRVALHHRKCELERASPLTPAKPVIEIHDSLGTRTLIVSRVLVGWFNIHAAGGCIPRGWSRYQRTRKVFCMAPLSLTRALLGACRSCRIRRSWSYENTATFCPCTSSVTDCQVSFQIQVQIQIRLGRTMDQVIERANVQTK